MIRIFQILLFFNLNLFGQTGNFEAIYLVKGIDEPKQHMDETTKRFYNNTIEQLRFIKYSLVFNENEAFFSLSNSLKPDNQLSNGYLQHAKIFAGKDNFYSNLKEANFFRQKELLGDTFIIKDSIYRDWTITKESKQIDQYRCYKATLKLNRDGTENSKDLIIAWFTPELSFSFGPKNYSGLPGLILELEENNTIYYIKSIKSTNKEIKPSLEGIPISSKKFDEYVKEKIYEYGFEKKQ